MALLILPLKTAAISPRGIETGTKSVYDIRDRFFWQHFDQCLRFGRKQLSDESCEARMEAK
jgi:hypothetical protein